MCTNVRVNLPVKHLQVLWRLQNICTKLAPRPFFTLLQSEKNVEVVLVLLLITRNGKTNIINKTNKKIKKFYEIYNLNIKTNKNSSIILLIYHVFILFIDVYYVYVLSIVYTTHGHIVVNKTSPPQSINNIIRRHHER